MKRLKIDRGTLAEPRMEGAGVSKSNPLGLKYIYRIEADWPGRNKEPCGWRCKFPENYRLSVQSKSWYEVWHGGKQKALQKAIAWRNTMMRKHGIPLIPRRLVRAESKSDTGVRGVYKHTNRQLYVVLVAEDKDMYSRAHFPYGPGRGRRKVYTEREAFLAAVRYRLAAEKRVYGKIISKVSPAVQRALAEGPKTHIEPLSRFGQPLKPRRMNRGPQTRRSLRRR